jgi:hypothetical protein
VSLTDMMAADLAVINSTTGDLPTSGTLAGCDGAASGTIVAFFGDQTDGLQSIPSGSADQRTAPVVFTRSEVLAILGRDMVQGDTFTVATGANAGAWIASAPVPDEGDGVNVAMQLDAMHTAGRIAR